MPTPRLHDDMTLEDIMQHWPASISVLLRYHMLCIGCPITSFHTVTDACSEHGIDEEDFVDDLREAIYGRA